MANAVDLTDVRIWAEQKGFKFVKSSAATAEGVSGNFFCIFNQMPFDKKFRFFLEIFELVASASMEETRGPVEKNFTNAQIEAVKKIRSARDNYERLGLMPGLINFYGVFRRLRTVQRSLIIKCCIVKVQHVIK